MRIILWFPRLLVAAIVTCIVLPAAAAEGRVPIWKPTAIGPGSPSGKYALTRDVNATGTSGAAISITGGPGLSEVEIDLNGFTLLGDAAGGPPVISATGLKSLTIRNGSVRHLGGFGDGIYTDGVETVVIEDLKIQDVTSGIDLERVSNFVVRRNVITRASFNGIFANGFGAPGTVTGIIENNQVENAGNGIYVRNEHLGVQVRHNRVLRTSYGEGIILSQGKACLIVENTVEQAGANGITLDGMQSCKVINNVTSFNAGSGIASVTSPNVLFRDNVSTNNTESGVWHDGASSMFDGNVLTENGCYGLYLLGPKNVFGRNVARSNHGGCPGPCGVAPVEVCSPPYGGGSSAPDLCVNAPGNTSLCDNTMPGPPRS